MENSSREAEITTRKKYNANLPQEIITIIFSKLPIKSVGRLRCLSKSWYHRLSSSQFIKQQLISYKNHQPSLLLFPIETNDFRIISPSFQDHYNLFAKEDYDLFAKTSGPIGEWGRSLGSCNGLILLGSEKEELTLLNPITKEEFYVPLSPIQNQSLRDEKGQLLTNHNNGFMYGLGYDDYKDDYKIVQVAHHYDAINVRHDLVHIYSVKFGVWRSWKGVFPSNDVCFADGIFLYRALHWLSSGSYRGPGNNFLLS